MSAWQAAWRLRHVALAASVLMFVLNMLLYLGTQSMFAAFEPSKVTALVLGVLYLLPDALFVAMVLEAMLAAGGVTPWRQAFLPSGRALLFALAMAPFAVLTTILLFAFQWPVQDVLLSDGGVGIFDRLVFAALYQPAWDWLLLGLIVAPLVVRILALPRLVRRPRSRPSRALCGTIIAAAALSVAVTVVFALPVVLLDVLPLAMQWVGGYLAALMLLTPVAAAVGALLVRRAAQPLEA